jgi:hypothetical protein
LALLGTREDAVPTKALDEELLYGVVELTADVLTPPTRTQVGPHDG